MRVNGLDLQGNNQNFGRLYASAKTRDYLRKDVFKNFPEFSDTFKKAFKIVKKNQINNDYCDIELFKAVNLRTDDVCPAVSISLRGGGDILTINAHQENYAFVSDAEAAIDMLIHANDIADNFKKIFPDIL